MGTKGKCHLGRCRIEGETNWRYKGLGNNPYDAEQKALIDSIRNGKPINSGYHMIDNTMIGVLGQIACYTGKEVSWEAAYNSDLRFGPPPEESNFNIESPVKLQGDGNYPLMVPGVTKLI